MPATVDADILELDLRRGHALSGPIAVRGAEPGDVLKVEILAVETDSFGSTAVIPGFGLLGDIFEDPYLVTWGMHDGVATSARLDGVRIPADPFVGVIGVAPRTSSWSCSVRARLRHRVRRRRAAAGARRRGAARRAVRVDGTAHDPAARDRRQPRRQQARAGATLFLPVVCRARCSRWATGTSRRATARSAAPRSRRTAGSRSGSTSCRPPSSGSARRLPASIGRARLEGIAGHFVTTGLPVRPTARTPTWTDAGGAQRSARDDRLAGRRARPDARAGLRLCSVAVDLRISEIVDIPNPVVSALCPLDIFHSIPPAAEPEMTTTGPRPLRSPGHRLPDRLRRPPRGDRRRLPKPAFTRGSLSALS